MIHGTVPLRRNLTGKAFANRRRTDTEWVRECERNEYRTDIEQKCNRKRTVTDKKRRSVLTIREHVLQNTC